jgi:hypothetical protein
VTEWCDVFPSGCVLRVRKKLSHVKKPGGLWSEFDPQPFILELYGRQAEPKRDDAIRQLGRSPQARFHLDNPHECVESSNVGLLRSTRAVL